MHNRDHEVNRAETRSRQSGRQRTTRRQRRLLAAIYLVNFTALLDVTVVITALPSIRSDLGTTAATMQWVVSAYTLCLATLGLSGGVLGDRYGRKRMFLLGAAIFVLGSVLCGIEIDPAVLIAGRFGQGIGAAIAVPGGISLIAQEFRDPAQRARMIGGSATVAAIATLVGPVLGGVLVSTFGWPSIFWINIPLGVIALILGCQSIDESDDPDHAPLDACGQALAICWLGSLTFGLILAGEHGWTSIGVIVALSAAVIGFVAFLVVELRQATPMLPIRSFQRPSFLVPTIVASALGFTAYAMITIIPTYVQQTEGGGPLIAAALLVPSSVAGIITSTVAGRWVGRSGPYPPMLLGLLLVAVSMALLLAERPDGDLIIVGLSLTLLGGGASLALTPTVAAALAAVDQARSGMASATVNGLRQAGTTLGIALLGGVMATDPQGIAAGPDESDGAAQALHVNAAIATAVVLAAVGLLVMVGRRWEEAAVASAPAGHMTSREL